MASPTPDFAIDGSALFLNLDLKSYELEAAQTTALHFINRYYVFLDQPGANRLRVRLKPKKKQTKTQLEDAAGEFFNTLLADTLRLAVNRRNGKLREKIMTQALSAAMSLPDLPAAGAPADRDAKAKDLLELDEELKAIIEKVKDVNYVDDPLGIGVPVSGEPAPARRKAPASRPAKKTSAAKKK